MSRRIVGPFNRVEGDLEVTLDIDAGRVQAAYVNAPLYRGFEQILLGKVPQDALVFVPRICGICSVAQSAASAQALADACGWQPPDNGRIAANLMLATENLADHLTHFYLYFMPDFARAEYAGRAWFAATEARFKAMRGTAAAQMLPARAAFLRTMGLIAGKWPHTLALQPGGSSRPLQASEKIRLRRILREFRAFLEATLFGDALESVAALASVDELAAWGAAHAGSDFGRFLAIADSLALHELGRGAKVFMSYGNFPQEHGRLFPSGVWDGAAAALEVAAIREDVRHAWYAEAEAPQEPASGATLPLAEKEGAYSWCKAPRLDGRVVEVGALARQVVAGQPLARALAAAQGGNVLSRVVMRLVEIARVLPEMERWAEQLAPGEPYCVVGSVPDDADGIGLVEAARGSLGHWIAIRRGRIHNYQIIAPTTWNFSPRDAQEQPGALEQALVGIAAGADGPTPAAVQHVVRSFDPCMVCTVH
ncbi:MAG: nickel-dependent hydrogenase large subunit [Rhodocyclaceae bacterium]|nr:nickel-dependent hydrogenase large subunit [Rhodocyclaceae bacterium]